MKLGIVISSIILLIPMIIGFCLWNQLPEQIATNFGFNGEVTGYSSKLFAVAGLPLVLLAANLVCIAATMADPKRKNISGAAFNIVIYIIPAISLLCCTLVYAKALSYNVNIETVMPAAMGILFALIGVFLPKCKQNYTMGIKLPWTLNDEENWNKTHRMAGPVWIIGGVVTAVLGILRMHVLYFAVIIALAVIPCVYSFMIYKKSNKEK